MNNGLATFDYETARENLRKYRWDWLVVTAGVEGIHVINAEQNWHIQEEVQEVADVREQEIL